MVATIPLRPTRDSIIPTRKRTSESCKGRGKDPATLRRREGSTQTKGRANWSGPVRSALALRSDCLMRMAKEAATTLETRHSNHEVLITMVEVEGKKEGGANDVFAGRPVVLADMALSCRET